MLSITVPSFLMWDEVKEEFFETKETTLLLEHSLVSLSKWESKWNKIFLSKEKKTDEEVIDYVRCMTITQNVDPNIYKGLSEENLKLINDYISAPMTATYFSSVNKPKGSNREQVTSELIYYWMISLNVPFECQKWHLNRLLTLIEVCNIKNKPPEKMSKSEIFRQNRELNEARKKQLNTRG